MIDCRDTHTHTSSIASFIANGRDVITFLNTNTHEIPQENIDNISPSK